jgi:Carboxypeptidase regulatory-like domain
MLLTGLPAWAQTGALRVRVTDPTGARVPRATVSVRGSHEKIIRQEETDGSGEIVLTELPMGECAVSVIKGGFLTVRRKALIRSAEEERLEVRLQLSPPLE